MSGNERISGIGFGPATTFVTASRPFLTIDSFFGVLITSAGAEAFSASVLIDSVAISATVGIVSKTSVSSIGGSGL